MRECEKLIDEGYTKEAAEELCETAKALGIKPAKLIAAARRLEREGIALTREDWLVVKDVMSKGYSLGTVVDYIIKRHRSGLSARQIIEELPLAASASARRAHILGNLIKLLHAPEWFIAENKEEGKAR
ncbi:hypothetical protein [Thermoproteus tenax]|uniref:Type II/IV secretion system membrane component, FlaJ/TadC family n=1 Tax=Thermoproteus tenax (strain ATCC 35583 / DSM 2078 / JCM 9277 / NBRC 100435 / Kra 1) TaxID=768679 RepID=G4RPW8_THETK|nr:hypothetical protein [Thermoproteus tenax]CCC81613.1 Type II/IV secretion system membrane component, FlaJ/TadC family [Thermoproteus tenax Kra 1]